TTFDIMYVAIFVCDNQRPLKLAHILSIDAEVRLEGNFYLDALWYVNETSPAPHSTVERGELVVVGGNDGRPVLAEELLMLAQAGVGVHEDDAELLEIFPYLVVDDLRVVDDQPLGDKIMWAVHLDVVDHRGPRWPDRIDGGKVIGHAEGVLCLCWRLRH